MENEILQNESSKKTSIFKKIGSFIVKNKKPIILTILVISIVCALILLAYKFFVINTNDDKLYENFKIVNVQTKEDTNRDISNDSTFFIETDEKVNVESVRNKIYVDPPIDYEIKKINAKKYELIPEDKLLDNEVYSISDVKNKTQIYKWAFETKRKLSVRYYDDNLSNGNTLKVSFSMEDVEDINKYVTITPAVKGTWVKHNSTWVFENKEKFKNGVEYTITVSGDLKAGKYKLDKNFEFTAHCYDGEENRNSISTYKYTIDGVNTFTSKEQIKTVVLVDESELDNKNVTTKIYKFKNINDFKTVVNNKSSLKISDLEKVREEKIKVEKSVLTLKKSLPNGWYVLEINYKNKKAYQFVQISDVQAYAITTERDTLVWTIKDGKVKSGIDVELNGKTVKSDKDGIAKFSDINNDKMDSTYITVDTNSKNPTLVLTKNYDKNNYPNGYVYTDRPLYKPTDTINVWGYVPLDEFYDKVSNDFVIGYGNIKKKVKVDENGVFNTKIKLNNVADTESLELTLYYKDTYLASKSVQVYDYVKPTYTYSINMNKHVYYAGDTVEFDVNVEHITGLIVEGKKVKVSAWGNTYTATTNNKGVAHFKIKTSYNGDYNLHDNYEINVYTGDDADDYDNYQATSSVIVYNYNIDINTEVAGSNGNFNLTIKSNKIDFKKTEEADDYDTVLGEKYNGSAKVEIYKEVETRYSDGSYYDDYEGKMVEDYRWETSKELVDTKTVKLNKGQAKLNNLNYVNSVSDEEKISYYVVISIKDTKGRTYSTEDYFYEQYIYNNTYDYNNLYCDDDYYRWYDDNRTHNYSLVLSKLKEDYYGYYKAKDNEEIPYYLIDKKGQKVAGDGKVLTVFYKEGIIDTKINNDNDLKFKFNKKLFPGSYIAAAYLKDGKVYSVANTYIDFDEEEKESKITIVPGKEEYKPGEEAKIKINVKDNNGNNIKSAINVSIVDEAIFEIAEDTTNILDSIYRDRLFSMYQMSTNKDYYYVGSGGRGSSGGGSIRFNFKDTAYFTSVVTDRNGNATVKFKLPDNITKYRITVHSANKDEYVGVNTKSIVVTQDFFIESPTPTNVKYNDDLVINAISHGKDIKGTTEYTFEINDKKLTSSSDIDRYTSVNFGNLPVGEYDLKITAKNGDKQDAIIQKIKIVGNTLDIPVKTVTDLNNKTNIIATKNPITLEIYDKKLDKYLTYVNYLGSNYSSRFDKRVGTYEMDRFASKFYQNSEEFIYAELSDYIYENKLLSNKPNNKNTDILLSAIANIYTKNYFKYESINGFDEAIAKAKDSSKDYYAAILGLASNKDISLSDLDNINKNDKNRDDIENIILYTTYGILGDYDKAKSLYKTLNVKIENNKIFINKKEITNDDISGMLAILSSMVDKNTSSKIIDILIDKNSTTMYLNFAIIAYLENNTEEISSTKTVTLNYGKVKKEVKLSGFNVERIDIDNKDLQTLKFTNASNDLKVAYYYSTGIDEIKSDSIKKDVKVTMKNSIKKNATVNLNVKYNRKTKDFIDLKIAIPNGLSLNREDLKLGDHMYLTARYNSYIIITIDSKIKNVNLNIPFTAVNDGKYVFEPVVIMDNDLYHISNRLNINIKK